MFVFEQNRDRESFSLQDDRFRFGLGDQYFVTGADILPWATFCFVQKNVTGVDQRLDPRP